MVGWGDGGTLSPGMVLMGGLASVILRWEQFACMACAQEQQASKQQCNKYGTYDGNMLGGGRGRRHEITSSSNCTCRIPARTGPWCLGDGGRRRGSRLSGRDSPSLRFERTCRGRDGAFSVPGGILIGLLIVLGKGAAEENQPLIADWLDKFL